MEHNVSEKMLLFNFIVMNKDIIEINKTKNAKDAFLYVNLALINCNVKNVNQDLFLSMVYVSKLVLTQQQQPKFSIKP